MEDLLLKSCFKLPIVLDAAEEGVDLDFAWLSSNVQVDTALEDEDTIKRFGFLGSQSIARTDELIAT